MDRLHWLPGLHCQAAARWRVEGGDNCSGDPHFWLEVWLLLVIMLCANGSGAPCTLHPACSSYCLAPKNLTPIIKLCTVAVQRQGQRVTLYCWSRQWRSSYPAHSLQIVIFTGPSKSVFLQYMPSTISQYKPRLWWYCHQFTTTLTTTLFMKQCAVNAECYHCTMKSSRLQPSESCNHRQFEYHPPGLQYIDGIVTYFGFQFTFHLGLWIMYWVTVLHIYNICMRMNRFNGTTIIQHWTLQTASIIMIFHLHPLHRMLDDDLQKLVKMVDIYLVV